MTKGTVHFKIEGKCACGATEQAILHVPGTFWGHFAGADLTTGQTNVCIGHFAGADLTTESNVVIIGDGIKSLCRSQKDVLFIGDRIAIGRTLFGISINLREVIEAFDANSKMASGIGDE